MTGDNGHALISHHPALDETRAKADIPVVKVTLLEDRAQVRREGRVTLTAGRNRLALWNVSPVAQDVSLRVEVQGPGKAVDARVRRAMRIGHKEKPEAAGILEAKLDELARQFHELAEDRSRAEGRASVVVDMMHKAMNEVPEDAAWSVGHPQTWRETFEALSAKARALSTEERAHRQKMIEIAEHARHIVLQRQLLDSPDTKMLCVVEMDIDATAAGDATVAVEYVVPNALWRPFHSAELKENKLRFSSQAAVWQNTGEDWKDAELVFSTARSSLGHEPPKLSDDKLAAQKKDQRVVVAAREVAVSNAGLGRGQAAAAASGVQLPGVDDGGDIQNLKSRGRITVPSDGRPVFVPVFDLESEAEASLVVMAELDDKAFFKSVQPHTGLHPILAGPVELVRASGFVGTTRTLFVAPGERFQLGFGPDNDVRVQRTVDVTEETDHVDKWRRKTHTVSIFLSNLSGDEKQLEISERIPVSEIEHVEVTLVADKTSGAPSVSDHGIVMWKQALPANGRLRLQLVYVVALAPGVQM
jgi:uncharacterized protein (TIGR02231 family)